MIEVGVLSSCEASERNCFCRLKDSSRRPSIVLKLAASGWSSVTTPLSSTLSLRFSPVICPALAVKDLSDLNAQPVMKKTPRPQAMNTRGNMKSTVFLKEPRRLCMSSSVSPAWNVRRPREKSKDLE